MRFYIKLIHPDYIKRFLNTLIYIKTENTSVDYRAILARIKGFNFNS